MACLLRFFVAKDGTSKDYCMETNNMRVMVVDDEVGLCQTLSTILEVDGWDVVTANSGDEALTLFTLAQETEQAIDLLITDISMPRMTGIELVRELRKRGILIPVLVISGRGTMESAVEMMRLGAVDFIDKPFSADVFHERIAAAMNRIIQNKKHEHTSHELNVRSALHDFNNWLFAIIGNAEFLVSDSQRGSSETQLEYTRKKALVIIKAAELASQTLERIKKPNGASSSINVHDIISDILLLQKNTVHGCIVFTTQYSANNPMIFCDLTDIKNAVNNLVINALHAMEHCSDGNLTIMTSNSIIDNNPYVTVTISDTGCGMNESIQHRLFEPGFSTKKGAGHGLGLYSVREAMTNCGGTVSVRSIPGQGSTFTLTIPSMTENTSTDSTQKKY
jgi:signal transduction histidine kinase